MLICAVRRSLVTMSCILLYPPAGFVQTPRGFVSNMVVGSSFGIHPDLCSRGGHMDHHGNCTAVPSWASWVGPGATGVSVALAPAVVFATHPSMKIQAATGTVGVANRGLGSAGLYLQQGRGYEFEAWVLQDTTATMYAELRDFRRNVSLSRAEFSTPVTGPDWGATWGRVNFTLTPSSSTLCTAIPYGSDPAVRSGRGLDSDRLPPIGAPAPTPSPSPSPKHTRPHAHMTIHPHTIRLNDITPAFTRTRTHTGRRSTCNVGRSSRRGACSSRRSSGWHAHRCCAAFAMPMSCV